MNLKKKIKYRIKLKKMNLPHFINYYLEIKRGLNFFFGRSYDFKLLKKNNLIINNNNNSNLDYYYDRNKILLYNKIKVLKYMYSSYKYKIKFKRSVYNNKIEGITLLKSFLNNFIKLKGIPKRFKRIKIKKRNKMERRKIPKKFRSFFYFTFFFYLNKFNIIIDTYYKNFLSFNNLIKIYNSYTNNKKEKRYKFTYIFRYKSKRIYKKRKSRKYGVLYNNMDNINKQRISFLFFY
jgi:hypothetical protein